MKMKKYRHSLSNLSDMRYLIGKSSVDTIVISVVYNKKRKNQYNVVDSIVTR